MGSASRGAAAADPKESAPRQPRPQGAPGTVRAPRAAAGSAEASGSLPARFRLVLTDCPRRPGRAGFVARVGTVLEGPSGRREGRRAGARPPSSGGPRGRPRPAGAAARCRVGPPLRTRVNAEDAQLMRAERRDRAAGFLAPLGSPASPGWVTPCLALRSPSVPRCGCERP